MASFRRAILCRSRQVFESKNLPFLGSSAFTLTEIKSKNATNFHILILFRRFHFDFTTKPQSSLRNLFNKKKSVKITSQLLHFSSDTKLKVTASKLLKMCNVQDQGEHCNCLAMRRVHYIWVRNEIENFFADENDTK